MVGDNMADENLKDGEEQATWEDVINNIEAGNVATEDNQTYALADKYRVHTNVYTFTAEPAYKLTVHAIVGDEDSMTWKNGYTVGLTYVEGDITSLDAWKTIQYWIASPDPEKNIYTTAHGTPCAKHWDTSGRFYFDYYDEQQEQHTMQIDEWSFTLNRCSFSSDPMVWENRLDETMWGSHATEHYDPLPGHEKITWNQGYGPDHTLLDETQGEAFYGYDDLQNFMDEMSDQEYEPIEYPGEYTDEYGGGGDGTYSNIDDIIEGGHAPTVNPLELGFVKVYNPSESDCRKIAAWLWSDDFDQNIKKNFTSPFENIISFGYMPLHGKLGTMLQENMVVGNCQANGGDYGSAIPLNKVMTYAVKIDCGELSKDRIAKYWNGFLDYDSTFTLWLPYVGYRSIRADDIFNKNDKYGGVKLTCWIDVLTGMIVWEVHSLINGGNKVVATFSGNCLSQMPISGANFMSMYNQQLSATVAGNQNIINKAGQALGAIGNTLAGNYGGAAGNVLSILGGDQQQKLIDRQAETAKPEYGRAGNMSANVGSYGYRTPYFIKSIPICSVPNYHNHYNGVPAGRYIDKLSGIKGYTEMQAIELHIPKATQREISAIEDALKTGTFL